MENHLSTAVSGFAWLCQIKPPIAPARLDLKSEISSGSPKRSRQDPHAQAQRPGAGPLARTSPRMRKAAHSWDWCFLGNQWCQTGNYTSNSVFWGTNSVFSGNWACPVGRRRCRKGNGMCLLANHTCPNGIGSGHSNDNRGSNDSREATATAETEATAAGAEATANARESTVAANN